jgi:signal transduction histidine kinase
MLLALHAALAWDPGAWWARAFLLAHFGLFLIWQPVWRRERNIESRHALLVVAAGVALAASGSWWLVAVWLAVLVGLIGGSVPGIADRRRRVASILAALYLLSMLLIWVVPQIHPEAAAGAAQTALVQYGLLLVPVAISLTRAEPAENAAPVVVDLFYSVLLFLLVLVLVLGSFVVQQVSHSEYPLALAQALFVIAFLLVALSWLWNPRGGFSGLGHMLSRYLLSIGLPFERWIHNLAELAQEEAQPDRFIEASLQRMLEMPWVTGLEWRTGSGGGEFGRRSAHAYEIAVQEVALRIYSRWRPSPAMLFHTRLLAQMVGYFYRAKQRERAQRQNAYTQAIYETGSRLTHDVKNLLQSLHSLCAVAESSAPDEAASLQVLMQRQLPQITQRLKATLEKLAAPGVSTPNHVDAAVWWDGLVQRYGAREIEFHLDGADGAAGASVPAELYDSVAANLIENALRKRQQEGGVRIEVRYCPGRGGRISVCDSGSAVPGDVEAQLFLAPVASSSGLGVGLYHAARQAAQLGYVLMLSANERGRVCFELARAQGD